MPVLAFAAAALLLVVMTGALAGAISSAQPLSGLCAPEQRPSDRSLADIPPTYLGLYVRAGAQQGMPWQILAAVGKVESDHGRGKGSGIRSGRNFAGAMGPMQFLAGTWKAYQVDGNGDGKKNVYDPADAIPGAARLLKANGAPEHLERAIFNYNHSGSYVKTVLAQAKRYAAGQNPYRLAHVAAACATEALPPNAAAAKVITYARAQLGKPYVWGAEGPDSFDCSGLTMMAYRSAGISIPRVTYDQWRAGSRVPRGQEHPGDLVFFRMEAEGPGHVGIVTGHGKMINARCTRCRPGVATQKYTGRKDLVGFARFPSLAR